MCQPHELWESMIENTDSLSKYRTGMLRYCRYLEWSHHKASHHLQLMGRGWWCTPCDLLDARNTRNNSLADSYTGYYQSLTVLVDRPQTQETPPPPNQIAWVASSVLITTCFNLQMVSTSIENGDLPGKLRSNERNVDLSSYYTFLR